MTVRNSAERFRQAALVHDLDLKIITFDQPTRTAQEAAVAVDCDVAQIVKSLCFVADGQATMALVSGANQLDTKKLARLLGLSPKRVKRADAEMVRSATGYAIGGVPPFGHATELVIFIDETLLTFDTIWAAAGTPHAVFPIAPARLAAVTGGQVGDIKQSAA